MAWLMVKRHFLCLEVCSLWLEIENSSQTDNSDEKFHTSTNALLFRLNYVDEVAELLLGWIGLPACRLERTQLDQFVKC